MIPKIIHYCWFGGNPHPKELQGYIESWKKNNPDFEIREWNESNFDISSHPFMKQAYDQKAWAFVSDIARLQIIEQYGGIYLDTDVEVRKSLEPLLQHKAYFPIQQNGWRINTGLGFGAEPHDPTVQALLHEYDGVSFDTNRREELSCPNMNSAALKKQGWSGHKQEDIFETDAFSVYPPRYFDPVATGHSEYLLDDQTYSIHHYDASWMPASRRLKRRLVNALGPETTHKIKKLLRKA